MAIPVTIQILLNDQVIESSRIEYKADFSLSTIIHTSSAFANDIDNIGGGYLIIGIDEKDEIPQLPVKGIPKESADGILKKLLNGCNLIEPRYIPVVKPVLFEGRQLILIWAKGGIGRPYSAPKNVTSEHSLQNYYIRKRSSTIKANQNDLKQLYYVSETIPFDDTPNLRASLSDISLGLMKEYLEQTGSTLLSKSGNETAADFARDIQLVQGPRKMNILWMLRCLCFRSSETVFSLRLYRRSDYSRSDRRTND